MTQDDQREIIEQLAFDLYEELERAKLLLIGSERDAAQLVGTARLMTYLEITLSMVDVIRESKGTKTKEQNELLVVSLLHRVQELRTKLNEAGLSTSIN